jgi:methionine-gamma-lyase
MDGYHKRTLNNHTLKPQTLMMGYGYDTALSEGAIKAPIFQTSTFVFDSAEAGKDFFAVTYGLKEQDPNKPRGLIYSRINNPNCEILEDRLTIWDAAEKGLAFSSGMAAISTTFMALARPGDAIAHSTPVYGGTEYLLHKILPQFGITSVPLMPEWTTEQIAKALSDADAAAQKNGGRLRLVHLESPANPTNAMMDIAAICKIVAGMARDGDRPLVSVDNTLLGPVWQHPLKLGADYVIYSLTKYVGGHSDVVGGACLGSKEAIARIGGMRTIMGTIMDPHSAWMMTRSLETLDLRMRCATNNAQALADHLAGHAKVREVLYLGHLDPNSAQGQIFKNQCSGAGSTFSVRLKGGEAEAFRFLNALRVIKLAVSLGGTESLASHPASMTHADYSPENKLTYGVTDDLVRISVGIEAPEDLIADVEQALALV